MTSRQQFSLRWNNYLRHVTSAFDALRCQEDLVDVTLCCEGKKIRAHKMLLSACSAYFKEIFKENPCQHPVIIFRNVRYEDLWAIINFMYHGEVNILQDQLASFLTTAELLEVQGLTDGSDDVRENNACINELGIIQERTASEDIDPMLQTKKRKISLKKQIDSNPENIAEIGIISIDTINPGNNFKLEATEQMEDTQTNTIETSIPSTSVIAFPDEIQICDPDVFHNAHLLNELKQGDGNQTNSDNTTDIVGDTSMKDASQGGDVFLSVTELKVDHSWNQQIDEDEPKLYACNKCAKTFKHPLSLRQHFKIHSGATRCKLCSKILSRVHDLKIHQNLIHGINIS